MSYNKIIVIGNLGRDPELRYTGEGKAVCNFSVATTEKWMSRGEQQEKTIWFKVTVWGKQGENASKYLSKGKAVYIEGRLGVEEWTSNQGVKMKDLVINASEIQYLSGPSNGEGGGGGRRDSMDQRRPGTDDHDQRVPGDALPLDGPKKDDDIPF